MMGVGHCHYCFPYSFSFQLVRLVILSLDRAWKTGNGFLIRYLVSAEQVQNNEISATMAAVQLTCSLKNCS
jgi:hypothetical protein